MITIRSVRPEDADALFPMIYQQPVTDTLLWDGPQSLESLRSALTERANSNARGETHNFTVIETTSGTPVGSCSIRPNLERYRGDIGLWIGQAHHGRGYGTRTVRQLVNYGFTRIGLEKIEASVFTGNLPSRRIFEKNGFTLEGTIRKAVRKRGQLIDEWLFGLIRDEWLTSLVMHICHQEEWESALAAGEYRADSLQEAGFIHASRPEQLQIVGARYFKNTPGLSLLWIDPQALEADLRWEASDGDIYPHIYGPLNLAAVIHVQAFEA